jgi:carbon-monoxide dehydrogenase small subunit
LMLAAEVDGRDVTTIEAVSDERVTHLQRAFVAEAGLQCGFCTPGMILAASRLPLDADAEAIRQSLVGNICRCTGYSKIVKAIQRAAKSGAGNATEA